MRLFLRKRFLRRANTKIYKNTQENGREQRLAVFLDLNEARLIKHSSLLYNRRMQLEEKVAAILLERKKTVAVAESCSGGLLSHRLTNIPGSSNYFKVAVGPTITRLNLPSLDQLTHK